MESYATTIMVDSRPRISKFVSSVSDDVVKKCLKMMLIKEINLSRLMVPATHIDEEKLKKKEKENKKAKTHSFKFS